MARRLLFRKSDGAGRLAPAPSGVVAPLRSETSLQPFQPFNHLTTQPPNHLTVKLIIAYIQPERLNAVKQALFAREIYKMSVTNALGYRRRSADETL